MKYTDKELIRASQIAYLQINQHTIEQMEEEIKKYNQDHPNTAIKPNYTLSELFEHSETFRKSAYKDICTFTGTNIDDYKKFENLDRETILRLAKDKVGRHMISERLDIIDDIKTGKIGFWKVVSYVDNNTIGTPGMAGKLVDGKWVHNNFSGSGAMIIL